MSEHKTNKELAKDVQAISENTDKQITELSGKLDRVVESTNEALVGVTDKLDVLVDAMAQNNPVVINKTMEPMEQNLGEEVVSEAAEVDGESVLLTPDLQSVDAPGFKDKMEALAFDKEPVTIMVHETSEKDADQVFDVSVNNITRIFRRGEQQTVPRMFVEQLARAKPIHYENEEYTKNDGSFGVRWPSRRGLRYPFSVIRDANPRGAEWLKSILAQP